MTLTASLDSVTYRVKGEEPVTCDGPGTPYRRISSNIGKSSPDCGFRFTKTGSKSIEATANWVIQWSVNGQQGSLEMPQSRTKAVEVRELHSVNVDPPG